jgi:hypothetical protein
MICAVHTAINVFKCRITAFRIIRFKRNFASISGGRKPADGYFAGDLCQEIQEIKS